MTKSDLDSFHYKAVFISDLHLGSGKTSSPYLYEFLKHLDYKDLKDIYLVGDIIGGWEHERGKTKPMPEIEKRIMDILNYAANNGVKVHYIPGNHDEKLRPLVETLQNRQDFSAFSRNVIFEQESVYETGGKNNKKFKVLHGDGYDPSLFKAAWFRPVAKTVSDGYDGFVRLDHSIAKKLNKDLGMHFSSAKVLKSTFKSIVGLLSSNKAALNSLKNGEYDGLIMGHSHIPGTEKLKINNRTVHVINDGDWVEGAAFACVEKDGQMPKVMDYRAERDKRGFGSLPDEKDAHPAQFQAYREQTGRQVQLIDKLWPQRDRAAQEKIYKNAIEKNLALQEERKNIDEIMARFSATGKLDKTSFRLLDEAAHKGRQSLSKKQKEGLKGIFNKHAAKQTLEKKEIVFVRSVLRDFMTHNDRKMDEQKKIIRTAGSKLNYQGLNA